MSYATIKKTIGDLLETLELAPASRIITFEDVSPNEYANTYILTAFEGEVDEERQGDLGDRLYDIEEWKIQIAFPRGTYSEKTELDKLHYKREDIIQKLDKPASWSSSLRMLRYKNWEPIQVLPDYFVLIINMQVIDTITY